MLLSDFGDGWEHTIRIEGIEPANPTLAYPLLIEAVGRCPPKDVGGPPGYEEFLAAMADPDHERHDELTDWHGEPFDPHMVDSGEIDRAVQRAARSWTQARKTKTT